MRPYKKYGDIYRTTKQVRGLLKNNPHGRSKELRDFWLDRIEECLEGDIIKEWDIIACYFQMFHLSFVIEKTDIICNWKLAVRWHHEMYKYYKP